MSRKQICDSFYISQKYYIHFPFFHTIPDLDMRFQTNRYTPELHITRFILFRFRHTVYRFLSHDMNVVLLSLFNTFGFADAVPY